MVRNENNEGFTLIELMTVLTIIAVLMAILFPCLNGAKKTARAMLCRSNTHSTGLAFFMYCGSSNGSFPPAYTYVGGNTLRRQPEEAVDGICHWSGVFLTGRYITEDALHCPEIPRGGLSPQNTQAFNLDQGQVSGREGIVDIQAERCAFTVNEILCPRNRFKVGSEGAQRPSHLVRISQVHHPGTTILLTEWPQDWQIVSGPNSNLSHSFLPVHGFRGLGAMVGPDRYDLNMIASDSAYPCISSGTFRKVNAYDLSDVPRGLRHYPPRLDWVGRNHKGTGTHKNLKKSTFFYLDGHTELIDAIESGETITFMLLAPLENGACFNIRAYIQYQKDGTFTIRDTGPILEVQTTLPFSDIDFDQSGEINYVDLSYILDHWLETGDDLIADIAPLGGDGVIDMLDLEEFMKYW